MITILIIAASLALVYVIAKQIMGEGKVEKSIDLAETLLPKEDIHAEIAKIAETIKAQEPVVTEKVEEAKPKKKAASKKAAPKMKAAPKKSK